jgi:uncharacterized membrane protein YjjB (DUF3815 family)
VSFDLAALAHQTLFGAIAAIGFGVLFNFYWRAMPWVGLAGALALAVRTLGLDLGWSLEGATFVAAATTAGAARLIRFAFGIRSQALAIAGCIPMVPGAYAAQTIFALFALTAPHATDPSGDAATALVYLFRVAFTLGAIGAGLAIVDHALGVEER